MVKRSSVKVPGKASADSFEFIIGLAEQRCMVLHPQAPHAGFVADKGRSPGTMKEGAGWNPEFDARGSVA
jgi:hypothetical protein